MPDTIPQPIANPTIKVFEFAVNTCHSEVIHPPSLYLFQLFDSLVKRLWSCFAGDGFQVLPEPSPVLIRCHQLVLPLVAFEIGRYKSKSQYLEVHRFTDAAFSPIDRKFQLVPEEQVDFISGLAGCLVTFCVDAKIITISNIRKPPV